MAMPPVVMGTDNEAPGSKPESKFFITATMLGHSMQDMHQTNGGVTRTWLPHTVSKLEPIAAGNVAYVHVHLIARKVPERINSGRILKVLYKSHSDIMHNTGYWQEKNKNIRWILHRFFSYATVAA